MSASKLKHVFGPVPSRRLGRSLGVDLVPFKTCTYDCIYCQLGRTTDKTTRRKEYVPVDEVLREVERKISSGVQADFITLSGSGEPTLHSGCGEIIRGIKKVTQIPVAVLTNGSLLWDSSVREGLLSADLVIPSLDAGKAEVFKKVNQPHPSIGFEQMVNGLIEFGASFQGQVWLEVFLLGGLTALEPEAGEIAAQIQKIKPNRIQLNTVARPPAYETALAVPEAEMLRLVTLFGESAEVVADFGGIHAKKDFSKSRQDVLDLLERRPCTLDDISISLGIHRNEAVKYLNNLLKQSIVTTRQMGDKLFYISLRH